MLLEDRQEAAGLQVAPSPRLQAVGRSSQADHKADQAPPEALRQVHRPIHGAREREGDRGQVVGHEEA